MEYNDLELLDYIHEGNEDALHILCEKYEPYIYKKASKLLKTNQGIGVDLNDILQEGRLALNEAIYNYKQVKDATFYTYVTTCMDRKMLSYLLSLNRLKYKALNTSISFDDNLDTFATSILKAIGTDDTNPSKMVEEHEEEKLLFHMMKDLLTDFEYQVFLLRYQDFNYEEIGEILGKNKKAIDNAIQRIRRKAENILKKEK